LAPVSLARTASIAAVERGTETIRRRSGSSAMDSIDLVWAHPIGAAAQIASAQSICGLS